MATSDQAGVVSSTVGGPDQLDQAVLAELTELGGQDDPGFLSGVLTAFLEESPKQLEAIESAIAGGDPSMIAKAAHSLKGSGRGIGASRLVELALALEQKGRAGKVTGGKLLLAQIKEALAAVSATVKKEISRRQASSRP